ncbi:uncharacterized protein [Taeniopygia guttata]|uniref:uncharacterized protein isoform X3 n=1 Tax=Taeniopygia guttata TaxID=59729 RepID=UPI003BB94EAC
MCSPAGPASPPQQHGPASASRGGTGRVAEGRFASATPQPSRSRRGPRRPGRAVAMRRTRSQPTPHFPAPPVPSPVPPQIPPRSGNLQAGPARRSRCDTRSHRGTHAPPPPDRAPQPATARPGRGGPGRAGWAAWDRGNARLGGKRDNAIVGVSFRCFSFSFVSFRFLSFLPPVTGVQRVSRSHLAAVPAGDASSEPVELFRTEGPPGTELRRAAAEPGGNAGGAAAPRRSPRPLDFCRRSGLPRRGERAHRGRGRGSLVRFFVVIKILLPRRAWISDEGRPPEPGAYAGQHALCSGGGSVVSSGWEGRRSGEMVGPDRARTEAAGAEESDRIGASSAERRPLSSVYSRALLSRPLLRSV